MNYTCSLRVKRHKIKSKLIPAFFKVIASKSLANYSSTILLWWRRSFLRGVVFSIRYRVKVFQNGATHAPYVKFPTSFSSLLNESIVALNIESIRRIYFSCLVIDNIQILRMEAYKKLMISIICTGEWHFFMFILAPVKSPTANSTSTITIAFRLSNKNPFLLLFGHPEK